MSKKSFNAERANEHSASVVLPEFARRQFLRTLAIGVPALAVGSTEANATVPDAKPGAGPAGGGAGTSGSPHISSSPVTVRSWEPEAVAESTAVFPRTVIAGDMRPTSFVVACYVADKAPKRLVVWRAGATPRTVEVAFESDVVPDADGFSKTKVDNLEAGTWYSYGLFDGEAETATLRSLIGRARTALAEGSLEPVTVGVSSCVGQGTVLPDYANPFSLTPFHWPLLSKAAERDFDAFITLGDQGYMDLVYANGGTYEGYLAGWGAYHAGGYRDLFPRSGIYATWDDHEVTDSGTVVPWTSNPAERQKIDNAKRAYYRVQALEADDPEETPLWRTFRWGNTVEFIILDCRQERTADRMMSQAQLDFLLQRLEQSPCHFKCVVTSVPFARVNHLTSKEDRWEGYGAERDRVKAFVNEKNIRKVLWVTGDIHMCYAGQMELPADDGSLAGQMWEICCTSGNTNPGWMLLPDKQFVWKSGTPHVPFLTFDPHADSVKLVFVDDKGGAAFERTMILP